MSVVTGTFRPVPHDFPQMVEVIGSVTGLAAHYRASTRAINRFFAETGLSPAPQKRRSIPCPEGFAENAQRMTNTTLSIKYDVSLSVIARWLRECGIKSNRTLERWASAKKFTPKPVKSAIPPPKRTEKCDIAAEYMRRLMPVFRCGPTGKYMQGGSHYRVGTVVMTPDELIAEAARRQEKEMRKTLERRHA